MCLFTFLCKQMILNRYVFGLLCMSDFKTSCLRTKNLDVRTKTSGLRDEGQDTVTSIKNSKYAQMLISRNPLCSSDFLRTLASHK